MKEAKVDHEWLYLHGVYVHIYVREESGKDLKRKLDKENSRQQAPELGPMILLEKYPSVFHERAGWIKETCAIFLYKPVNMSVTARLKTRML